MTRPLRDGDLEHIAAHLRLSDRLEVAAASGHDFLGILRQAADMSVDLRVFEVQGQAAAVLGVVPLSTPGHGIIWLLGTEALTLVPKSLTRMAKTYLRRSAFTHLGNYVDARNAASQRWLRALGFEVATEAVAFGRQQLPFYPFSRQAHV